LLVLFCRLAGAFSSLVLRAMDFRSAVALLAAQVDAAAAAAAPPPPAAQLLDAVARVRDKVDLLYTSECVQIAPAVPGICALLDSGARVAVSLQAAAPEAVLRARALELLVRLPSNDALRGGVPHVLRALAWVAANDNEENAAVAAKHFFVFHRHMRQGNEALARTLVGTALESLANSAAAVTHLLNEGLFEAAAASAAAGFAAGASLTAGARAAVEALDARSVAVPAPEDGDARLALLAAAGRGESMCPASHAFKVTQEVCVPALIAFQYYPHLSTEHLAELVG